MCVLVSRQHLWLIHRTERADHIIGRQGEYGEQTLGRLVSDSRVKTGKQEIDSPDVSYDVSRDVHSSSSLAQEDVINHISVDAIRQPVFFAGSGWKVGGVGMCIIFNIRRFKLIQYTRYFVGWENLTALTWLYKYLYGDELHDAQQGQHFLDVCVCVIVGNHFVCISRIDTINLNSNL